MLYLLVKQQLKFSITTENLVKGRTLATLYNMLLNSYWGMGGCEWRYLLEASLYRWLIQKY
jgi:hypothetical protein